MNFSNPPADRQSEPGSGVLLLSMESAQHFKHPFQIFLCNTDPVVVYGNNPFRVLLNCRNMDHRLIRCAVLECIADEILHQPAEQRRIADECRQFETRSEPIESA